MGKNHDKSLHIVTFIIIVLTIVTTTAGLFYTTGGQPFTVVNQYGDTIKMYGDGLYAHDSYFMVPISRGADLTILSVAIPILIAALVLDVKKKTLKNRMFLTSIISIFTYFSANIVFGVTYNILHLVYIALFSASVFGLIISIVSIDKKQVVERMGNKLPYKGIYAFLVLSGIALTVAWLPDIINSLVNGGSLELIEVYTTNVTYILDMGIIGPLCLICLFQLKKKDGMGYVLLGILLSICTFVGIMVPIQTVFQISAGIDLPIQGLITKAATFVVLAFFAAFFKLRLIKNIK